MKISTCPTCGSRIAEGESGCPACLLLGALDDPAENSIEEEKPDTEQIEGYEIVRQIGAGGSADVFLARQAEPIERDVAIKLIRPETGTTRVVARFEAEREVLAKLRHPFIANIFDAGQTGAGLPYFVMEYVDGVPVTEFAAREGLSLEQRLQLFVQICEAVTHAHQRGVVHRDLKPSNLLVDTSGQPKVIDFGIARALEEEGFGDHTLFLTQEGEMLGTPAYMSPEQSLGQMAEIDTRSDVFSLGAILYELLTGQLPVDIDRLRGASPLELRRILTETEFQRPSLRDTTTHIPGGAIRGDLDWIVMKALERDKERRYGSVDALAEDVGRHLANEPVSAGPPTVRYRMRKFVRRNRAMVGGTVVAVVALLAGTGISIDQARRATVAKRDAVAHAQTAEKEKRISDAINQFFVNDLLGADLRNTARPDVTLRELVDVAAGKTDERFSEQPEVASAVELAIGNLYDALGEFEKAEASYLRSREHNRSLADSVARDRAELHLLRKLAINANRRGRTPDALEYWEEWEAVVSRADISTSEYLTGKVMSIESLVHERRATEAIEQMRALLPEFESHFGVDHSHTLTLKLNLGKTLAKIVPDSEEGLRLLEEFVERTRDKGKTISHSEALSDLGLAYAKQGQLDKAEKALMEAIEIQDEILEPNHPSRMSTRLKLASSYRETGRRQLAASTYREAFEIGMQSEGSLPIESLIAGHNYALEILMTSPDKAKPIFERVLRDLAELGNEYGSLRANASLRLAIALWLSGDKDAAVSHLNDEVALGIEKGGESNPVVFATRKLLVEFELKRGQREAALPYARAALKAPIPTDEQFRKEAAKAVEQILEMLEVSFADQPEQLIETFRSALISGHTEDQVWRRLGVALYGRYQSGKELRDLRLACISLLRAGKVIDATGVRIITEWIGKDKLATGLPAPVFLIDSESVWHYKEATPDDPAWRLGSFDAGDWPEGRGKFGYGDGDEVTLLDFGDDPDNKPMSACFRLKLTVDETYERPLVATIAFDDGAIVYLDGEEVYRALLPKGDPGPDTPSTGTKSNEAQYYGFAIDPELLKTDRPVVIAAQVHQSPHESDDLSFAFSLAEPLPKIDEALARIPAEELNTFFGELAKTITNSNEGAK